MNLSTSPGPIGIFDSGYGGLTILNGIRQLLPQYDFLYLGDNARAPYGPRSFDVVYEFTRQAVLKLFQEGCQLVILGCNTASAKALRTIQQIDLPHIDPRRRVLGIIRPTAEVIGSLTQSRHVGVLATEGTIKSESYTLEIKKLFPDITVSGVACPFWVPLVEYNEADSPGADYFVKKRIDQLMAADPQIDAIILGAPIILCSCQKSRNMHLPTCASSLKATLWLAVCKTISLGIPRWSRPAPSGAPYAISPPKTPTSSESRHSCFCTNM